MPLLVQRLVLTKTDLERREAPRKEEGRVIQPVFSILSDITLIVTDLIGPQFQYFMISNYTSVGPQIYYLSKTLTTSPSLGFVPLSLVLTAKVTFQHLL